jgi:hypothetical protein
MNNCLNWNIPLSPLQGECRSAVLSQGIALLSPGLYSLGPLARWTLAESIGSFAEGTELNYFGTLAQSNGHAL